MGGFPWTWGDAKCGFNDDDMLQLYYKNPQFEIEDAFGNRMLVYDNFGYNRARIDSDMTDNFKVGDKIDEIVGVIANKRGSYSTSQGGLYTLNPVANGITGINSGATCTPYNPNVIRHHRTTTPVFRLALSL